LDSFLESIPFPAVLYKLNEQLMIPNQKAYQLSKTDISIKKTLENMLRNASQKDFLEYTQDIHFIGENENLVSFFCIQFDDYYYVIIQEISIPFVETIKNDSSSILAQALNDIVVTNGEGLVLSVTPSFQEFYGVNCQEILSKNVADLEVSGIFQPSATAQVLRTGQRVTLIQKTKLNNQIMVTAIPIKDVDGVITKVISFSYDVTDFFNVKSQYKNLDKLANIYKNKIEELRAEEIDFPNIIGKSKQMADVLKLLMKVSNYDANILLTGESGVGKTSIAHVIHSSSGRSMGPLIEVNCGAIPQNLLESELFGFEGGSFTGAKKEGKLGLIEFAENGTLFLDEISELPLDLQVKILKVIQDKTFNRVGGTKTIKVNFRLIAATNRDLKKLIEEKKFREDLFYRLNVINIHIPALRERKDDIFPLSLYFIEFFNKKYNLNKKLTPATIDLLIRYDWMGNIRELENVLERTILTTEGDTVREEFLPENVKNLPIPVCLKENYKLEEALDEFEGKLILKAYETHKTTVAVAKALGISQATAVRKIKKYVV
jgi:transcriptional regulator with PAS, ATPase and Fis domain